MNQIKGSNSPGNFRSKLNAYTPEQQNRARNYIEARNTILQRKKTIGVGTGVKPANYLNFNSILRSIQTNRNAAAEPPAPVPNAAPNGYKVLNAAKQLYYGTNNLGLYKKVGSNYLPVTFRRGTQYEWNTKKQKTPMFAGLNFGREMAGKGPSIYTQYPELDRVRAKLTQVKLGSLSTGAAQEAILKATMRPRTLTNPNPPYFDTFKHWETIKDDSRFSAKQKETVRKIIASIKAGAKFHANRPAINFNISGMNNTQIKTKLQNKVRNLERAENEERRERERENANRKRANSSTPSVAAASKPENRSYLYW